MKKNLIYISFAAIAMTFASCVNEDLELNQNHDQNPEGNKINREFVLDIATKTVFNEEHTALKWSEADKIGFIATTDGTTIVDHNTSYNAPESGNTISIPVDPTATVGYAYYPFIAGNATNPIEKSTTQNDVTTYVNNLATAKLFVSASQIQKNAGEFYGAMLPMYAKVAIPAESESAPTPILFKPAASILAVNIYGNAAEKVSYVKFTPNSGNIAGNLQYDWTAETIAKPSLKNGKNYVAVSLENPYSVPAAKPADKSGYIYMAVVPDIYAGGKFTVVTETSMYEFETAATLDLTNVYKPLAVPVNLEGKTPSSTYLYYDNFATATGHLGSDITYKDYTGTEVRPAHGALNIGTGSAVGTLTTPAFAFLGKDTKDVKVTFFANGWRSTNKLAVTASVGTVVDGAEIALGQMLNTDGSDRFSMDKSTPITVYVKGATSETTLTFTNDTADATDSKRFVIDDIAVEEYAAELEVAYTLDMSSKSTIATNSSYNLTYIGALENNGVTWTITKGAANNSGHTGWELGSNHNNYAACKLKDENATVITIAGGAATKETKAIDYSKVGTPCGYTGDMTSVAAVISESMMKNVQKVRVYNDVYATNGRHPVKISLVYSTNGETYTLIETQDYAGYNGGENVWTFDSIDEAYFAIVIYKETLAKAHMHTDCLKADFYAVPEI